jgi:CPA1 family monovalent cation:H+ antiporter
VNIIIPFMVLDFLQARPGSGFFDVLLSQVNPFLLKIFVGIGVGIVAGFVLFKVLRSVYEAVHSPLAMLTAAVLSYGLAERLGGSGVLSVTAVGAIFGNVYLAEPVRGKLMEIESVFSRSLFILLFVLFGTILEVQYTWAFLVAGIGLLIVYLCARYLIVTLALGRKTAGRVRAFMTLMSPNGAPAIAVASFVGGLGLPGAREVVGLTGFVIALQILVASVAVRFKDRLLPAGNPGAAGIDLLRQKARQQGLKEA